ncbi:MAG TPA: DMT family transporter, partial [Candidatus Thermoplasmatota archaeon]|nr:DMT family transporter [Candidatus Thermoplasmatota archaeon]
RLAGRNLALLLALGVLWGVAFMFIQLGLPSFSPVLFAAYRFDIAGGVILLIALARRSPLWPRSRAQWTAIAIAAVLNVTAYHALLFWGQRFTTPAVAAVIVGLNPVITTVLSSWLLSDERVGWHGVVGLALGLAGIIILATFKEGSLFDARGLGEMLIVLAVASWAMGSILVRRTRHGMDVFSFTAWQQLVGAGILHALAPFADRPYFAVWDRDGVVSLLYLALVSSSLGFLMYFTLLERIGPIRTNLVSHIAPVFAAIAGFVVMGTAFEWRAIGAFVLIASGFALVARPARERAPAASPARR